MPIGILTAIYLVEYGRGTLARAVSFIVDILTGVPSIVAALFIYACGSRPSASARPASPASLALVLLMIPVVVRSTEEMLKLVPNELREASYALGVPEVGDDRQDRAADRVLRHHHRRDARRSPASWVRRRRC